MSDIDEIATDPEELFPPRPGGAVDTARKRRAAEQPEQDEQPSDPVQRKPRPVPVKIRQPDMWGAKTLTIAAGASLQAMPADANRNHGALNLITASATLLIARDRSSADSGTGYFLLSGQPPREIGHTREVWVNNPGATAIQVSVLTESYAD